MKRDYSGAARRAPGVAVCALAACALALGGAAQERERVHAVPFFPASSPAGPEGLLRIVNESDEAGAVGIVAIDDAGRRSGELTLTVGARQAVHLDADALENGAPGQGLTGAAGPPGEGDWRLRLTSGLAIEPRAYARTRDGALWEMFETAPRAGDGYRVATFNPGANVNQVSRLRLVNAGDEAAAVTVRATDDAGASPGPGVVLEVPPGAARTLTAAELESGAAPGLEGSLGDGFGKWRLDVESAVPILAMSLLSSPTGHLTNLSAVPARESAGVHRVPLFPPASDPHGRQGFARVVNRSDAAGEVRIEAFDDTRWSYGALTLSVGARQTRHFNSADLEFGNAAKGLSGSTGAGEGDWRLELTSELDIEVLSYVRTVGGYGYVTPMHDTAAQEAREAQGPRRYYVPVFHPARHEAQRSRLHLVNLGAEQARVGIDGVDDAGGLPPAGASLVLGAGETRVLTAAGLEDGAAGVAGRFGTGSGRWRLFVSSEVPLQVMSLGYARDGFLANLSRGGPPGPVPAPPARPDLVVEAPSVSDGEPAAGAVFTLSATVRNRGGGDAGATTLRYHRSANDRISASDTQVGTDAVAGLGGSASVRSR